MLAEAALSAALPDLSPHETSVFLLDAAINARGFQIDARAVEAALRLMASEQKHANAELVQLTQGIVQKATQRAQMLRWFEGQGLYLEDTQKETIAEHLDPTLKHNLDPKAKRGLELLRTLGRSSTAKYEAMKQWADPQDWRVRGSLIYHGASTGRWTGVGVQPQNFPKGKLDGSMESTWTQLLSKHPPFPDIMETLSYAIRGAITASPQHVLFVADYAAIEARVLLWLAGDDEALKLFRTGQDIYCDMASHIYGRPISKADKDERALGKVAILGLGTRWERPGSSIPRSAWAA